MLSNLSDQTLLFVGAMLCAVAAWCTIGYYHPDEHFQIWEFAHYKLGEIPASDLAWEFEAKIRPGLQPFLAYCMVICSKAVGIVNPFVQVFFARLICGAAALFVYWKWCKWLERDLGNSISIRWMRLGILFFWLMPYLNVRFTSENTSAICFFGGLLLLVQALENQKNKPRLNLVMAGILLGLSFFFRYQIAFAGIGLVAWLLYNHRMDWPGWTALIIGAIFSVIVGLVTDFWLYGEWVFAPYNYFFSNIIEGKAANFGVSPFWWYLSETPIDLLLPLSIVLMLFFALGIWSKPRHILTWCVVPFVVAHSMVAHKEVRFLFPMALPFFFLTVAGWQFFKEKYAVKKWMTKTFVFCLWLNAVALTIKVFLPAKEMVAFSKFLWEWEEKHPRAAVYFVKDVPHKNFPLNTPFYENQEQQHLSWYTDPLYKNDTSALHVGDLMFFTEILSPAPTPPPGFVLKRAYFYYPDWILRNNTNDWQSRTRIWGGYRLEKMMNDE